MLGFEAGDPPAKIAALRLAQFLREVLAKSRGASYIGGRGFTLGVEAAIRGGRLLVIGGFGW